MESMQDNTKKKKKEKEQQQSRFYINGILLRAFVLWKTKAAHDISTAAENQIMAAPGMVGK